jgi:hypothetical protein
MATAIILACLILSVLLMLALVYDLWLLRQVTKQP